MGINKPTVTVAPTVTAENPREGLTLGELIAFVRRAEQVECTDGSTVKVKVNMRGGVKTLTVVDRRPRGGALFEA